MAAVNLIPATGLEGRAFDLEALIETLLPASTRVTSGRCGALMGEPALLLCLLYGKADRVVGDCGKRARQVARDEPLWEKGCGDV